MFSYVDLVRAEIAIEVGDQFGVTIPEGETDRWRTLGDVSRSVVRHAGGKTTEPDVFAWVRALIADGYGVAAVTPDEGVFGDYDRMTSWFMAAPYPHRLGDRWFARQRSERHGDPAEPGDQADCHRPGGS